jgi:hypothetical protein
MYGFQKGRTRYWDVQLWDTNLVGRHFLHLFNIFLIV